MHILVTGGAGFIGSPYARSQLAGRYASCAASRVTVLDELTHAGNLTNLAPVQDDPRLTVIQGDILGTRLVDELVGQAEVYNIGGGTEISNVRLTELLLTACNADWSAAEHVQNGNGHDQCYSADITEIATELGYAPQVTFTDGLAEAVALYGENRSWWEPLKQRAALAT